MTGIAPVPVIHPSSSSSLSASTVLPFHPTLSSIAKRYEYKVSMGAFPDPTSRTNTWYVGDNLNIEKMDQAFQILVGSHNFIAFQGVPRGPEEYGRKCRLDAAIPNNSTRCTLRRVRVEAVSAPSPVYFPGVEPAPLLSQNCCGGRLIPLQNGSFLSRCIVRCRKRKVGVARLDNWNI